jgi:hypothetical protein
VWTAKRFSRTSASTSRVPAFASVSSRERASTGASGGRILRARAALADAVLDQGWVRRRPNDRALGVTPTGADALRSRFRVVLLKRPPAILRTDTN